MPPTPFFCTLCSKGYARAPELEAHENSYDHQHKKRLKEMKSLTRNPTAAVKDSRAEKRRRENSEMISVNIAESRGERDRAERGGGAGGGGERGFRTGFATGFGGAVAGDVSDGRRDGKEDRVGEGEGKGEYTVVEGPIPWEKLDEVGDLVDLSVNRPREVQKVVGRVEEYMRMRKDRGFYEDIWRRVDALEEGGRGSESPGGQRVGLGA